MEQLNSFDAFFILSELKNTPQHISHIYIYDPGTSKQPVVRFKDILNNYEQRLHLAPSFKRQLVEVPFGLDNPYWIESPDFNLEYHVRHIALPKPGDWRQLSILLARLHSQSLDLSYPMWQSYVIEGLDGIEGMPPGAFAIMTKMHHAMVDGKAALEMQEAMHDSDSSGQSTPTPQTIPEETMPGQLDLLKTAGLNSFKQPLRTFSKARKVISAMSKKREFKQAHPELELKQEEKSLFNEGVTTAQRVWGAAILPISDFVTIKKSVNGATLNDVVLCITSFAVEQYLEKHDLSLNKSLISGMAVDTRSMSEYGDGSNHATFLPLSVHSTIEDPILRLAAIYEESQLRKQSLQVNGADMMRDALDAVPTSLLNMSVQLADKFDLLNQKQMGFHYATTNIPGPRTARYMVGAKVVSSMGMAPLIGSTGLAFVICSYCDTISVSFTCCRETVRDPDFLEQCIHDAYNKVLDAVKNSK